MVPVPVPEKTHGEAERRPQVEETVGFLAEIRAVLEENGHKKHWSEFTWTDCMEILDEEGREASEMIDRIADAMHRFPEGSDARAAAVAACFPNGRKEFIDMAIAFFFLWRWTYSENGQNGL